jgi:hypothetical protein
MIPLLVTEVTLVITSCDKFLEEFCCLDALASVIY